jgi:N6-L-threonylcarbamoyladenine synthase
MIILGIETSCDETAAAVVEDGTRILSSIVASQVDIHARYGCIVPEVASRQHILAIEPITRKAMHEAGVGFTELSAIAVTNGPGLAGSLLVGVNMAKAMALVRELPLIGINHLEAHIYANWLSGGEQPQFPLICLIVSGGHSDIVLMKEHGDYILLGQTKDDAAGEAFDKVARTLGLGYPGGPVIEKTALEGNSTTFPLPRAWLKGTDDFSFSGLKTAVLHLVEGMGELETLDSQTIADIAASFQESVIDVLTAKTIEAAQRHEARQILLAGGVSANRLLRDTMISKSPIPTRIPSLELCTDNAAMTAACGYYRFKSGHTDGWDLDVVPGLRIG